MQNKYAKLPKKYKVSSKNPAVWRIVGEVYCGHLLGLKYPLWLKRPICWLVGHHKRVLYPYGVKIKQCQRCSKVFYKKSTNEKMPNLYQGEVGELYGVRFVNTKIIKGGLKNEKD